MPERMLLTVAGTLICSQVAGQIPEIGQVCGSVCDDMPAQLSSRSRIAPPEEPGEPLIIEGVVRDRNGNPAEGVIVYAYQTNADGIYPPDARPPGILRAWARTGTDGSYRFDTIRPGAYPNDDVPAHVHLHIIEPGKVTYIVDDIIFSDDPLWPSRWGPDMRNGRGGEGLGEPTQDEEGVWHIRNDIILGENIAGYDAAWRD